ncbi:helix-turn-helix domain-containing protein [Thalassobacillus hwangdonensis]|uniref:Helix-turn-helix domain-containing protein n=1 Tax=Thalassobacillus hwangdonensis TaxID=546108 RepID=A0ABW3L554_9BACI
MSVKQPEDEFAQQIIRGGTRVLLADKYTKMDYGKLIYLERVNQGLTQKQLSSGICSITYLSKLENQRMNEPNHETLSLLLEKLHIDYQEQASTVTESLIEMELLYKNLISKNEINIKKHHKCLKSLSFDIYPDLAIWFDLLSIRYYVYWKNIQSAEELQKKLSDMINKLDAYQSFYFHYFSGLVHCLKKLFNEGTSYLHEAEELAKKHNFHDPELFYHLALTYSHLNHTSLAIYYSQSAKNQFDQSMNIYRSLDCQVILGINFLRIKRYDNAELVFKDILSVAHSISNTITLGKTFHNLGYLHSEKKNFDEAISYYHKSLKYKDSDTESYYRTVLQLTQVYQQMKEFRKAEIWVEKALKGNVKENDLKIQFQLKKLELQADHHAYYNYIRDIALPYFLKVNNRKSVKHYAEKAALHHEANFHYKKANDYYKMILDQGGDSI